MSACAHTGPGASEELRPGAPLPEVVPGKETHGGYVSLGGSMITATTPGEFHIASFKQGATTTSVLARLTHRDPGGMPHSTILAVLQLPPLKRGETYIFSDCYRAGATDEGLIVIGRWTRQAMPDTARGLRMAWKADPAHARFDTIAVGDVTCHVDEDRGVPSS